MIISSVYYDVNSDSYIFFPLSVDITFWNDLLVIRLHRFGTVESPVI